jgi:hypothetical protein
LYGWYGDRGRKERTGSDLYTFSPSASTSSSSADRTTFTAVGPGAISTVHERSRASEEAGLGLEAEDALL